MRASWHGRVLAQSEDIVTVEGNAYFPSASLDPAVIMPSAHTTVCPWKGTAHYYTLNVDGAINENAVWYYKEPKPAAAEIRGRVAFWKGVEVSP